MERRLEYSDALALSFILLTLQIFSILQLKVAGDELGQNCVAQRIGGFQSFCSKPIVGPFSSFFVFVGVWRAL